MQLLQLASQLLEPAGDVGDLQAAALGLCKANPLLSWLREVQAWGKTAEVVLGVL